MLQTHTKRQTIDFVGKDLSLADRWPDPGSWNSPLAFPLSSHRPAPISPQPPTSQVHISNTMSLTLLVCFVLTNLHDPYPLPCLPPWSSTIVTHPRCPSTHLDCPTLPSFHLQCFRTSPPPPGAAPSTTIFRLIDLHVQPICLPQPQSDCCCSTSLPITTPHALGNKKIERGG